jgi:truncated hemoglobin YjbI
MTNVKEDSLYWRLGGSDALARIANSWFERIEADADTRLFHRMSATSQSESIRALTTCLSAATGGCDHHLRSDSQAVGRTIALMSDLWETSANHLMEALENEGVSEKLKGEVASCMTGLRQEIDEASNANRDHAVSDPQSSR